MINSESVTRSLALIEQDPSKVLGISMGKHVVTPGLFVPKEDAQSPPEVTYGAASPSKSYVGLCVDLDAPFQTFSVLGPILHWVQPGLKSTAGSSALQTSEPCVANWGPPKPPAMSGPHRYVFLLYEQPSDFNAADLMWPEGPTLNLWSRVRFDLDGWEKKASLATAIAVNYFNSN